MYILLLLITIIGSGSLIWFKYNYWQLVDHYPAMDIYALWQYASGAYVFILLLCLVYFIRHFKKIYPAIPFIITVIISIITFMPTFEITYGDVYRSFYKDGHNENLLNNEQLLAYLKSGDFESLDQQYQMIQDTVHYSPDTEDQLRLLYYLFRIEQNPEIEPLLDQWVKATGSAYAYMARGHFLNSKAWKARGWKYVRDTPEENMINMRKITYRVIEDLGQALDIQADTLAAYDVLINAYGRIGKTGAARMILDQALKLYPDSYYLRSEFLRMHLQPKWGSSISEMKIFAMEAGKYRLSNPRLMALSGKPYAYTATHDFSEKPEKARLLYLKALNYAPLSSFYMGLADIYKAQKNQQAELEMYNKILEKHPTNTLALSQRAYIYVIQKRFPEASHDATLTYKNEKEYGYISGWIFEYTQEWDKAIDAYEASLSVSSDELYCLERLVVLYDYTNDYKSALKIARLLNKRQPDNPKIWFYMADFMYDLKIPEARKYIDTYFKMIEDQHDRDPEEIQNARRLLGDIKKRFPRESTETI